MAALAWMIVAVLALGCADEGAAEDLSKPPVGSYLAGFGVQRLPVPVGIGISGHGFIGADRPSITPFADIYPGTTKLHTQLDFRAMVVEHDGGGGRLVLVRADTIGVSAVIRNAMVRRLQERFGPEIDDQLLIQATHTHAGPGRLIDKPLWEFIQDRFHPELFERVVAAAVQAVEAAADDLEPARLGHAEGRTSRINSDRRCQNAENDWHEAHLVRVDKADGTPKGLLVLHPVHPVVLGINDLVLSQDVSGGIEAKLAEGFESPVTVMHINGAAADVGKAGPSGEPAPGAAPWPGGYEHIEALGIAAREDLLPTAQAIVTAAEGPLHARTVRARFDGGSIGYAPGEFPFEHGAVYCTTAQGERCFGEPAATDMLDGCVDFGAQGGAEAAPADRAPLTVARLGELVLVSTPGEMGVELGREIQAAAIEATGQPDVAIVGYANEYTGYSLKEDDWYMGGYEASGALWGPKQGEYLAGQVRQWVRAWAEDRTAAAPFDDPGPGLPPPDYDYEPYTPTPSTEVGSLEGPAAAVAPGEVVQWAFGAGDPWLGAPRVHLEQDLGAGAFEAVTQRNGDQWSSDGYAISLELQPDPAYRNKAATERTFRWTARLPVGRKYGGGPPLTAGASYRLVVSAPYVDAAGEAQELDLASGVFAVQ